MIRGTTPIHTFGTNVDLRNCKVFVTYKQNGVTILEKSNNDLTITETEVVTMLTQADTLRFKAGAPVQIQLRYLHPNGESEVSNVIETTVDEVLKQGVIV